MPAPSEPDDPIPGGPAGSEPVRPFRVGTRWREGDGEPLRSTHPGDDSLVAIVGRASLHDVDDAVAVAAAAFRDSGWRQARLDERAAVLRRMAERIDGDSEALARGLMRDSGEPLAHSEAIVADAARGFRYHAALCETWQDEVTSRSETALSLTLAEPWGVVAAITSATAPLQAAVRQLAPALAAGNAVILKPSEQTPLMALELARLAAEAGLPDGLVTVLPGDGPEIGAALVKHPDVRLASFSGTRLVGRSVATTAGNRLIPAVLGLGGSSAQLIFDDARLDEALDAVVAAAFESRDRLAVTGPRLFIQKSVYGRFLDALVHRARSLWVGLPADPQTRVGPLVSRTHQARALRAVDVARSEGARVLAGGKVPDAAELARGCFVLPTVLDGIAPGARLCSEEGVGPIVACLPFRDEDDLIAQANDAVPGLAAGIWTTDLERGWRIGRALGAGSIWVNAAGPPPWPAPVGGTRSSGFGYEQGLPGLRQYTRTRSVHLGLPGRAPKR